MVTIKQTKLNKKTTKIGLNETESNRVLIVVGIVIDHTVVNVLEPYDVNKKLKNHDDEIF